MTTKDSLIDNRESANLALLTLKQKYKKTDNKTFLIVEGKDDLAYYQCIMVRYKQINDFDIIPATNRKKVTDVYDALNWKTFSKKRILFLIDRDLSDITMEYTPCDENVYVTDSYSIENSMFNDELLLVVIRTLCGVVDLTVDEIQLLKKLYSQSLSSHENIFERIMAWILYWKESGYSCNLNNINSPEFYKITQGNFAIKDEYTIESIEEYIHTKCQVNKDNICIEKYIDILRSKGPLEKFIRGKFLKCFFVKFLDSIINDFTTIFFERKKPKLSISFGPQNILQILCGYMETPASLDLFLKMNLV